jgi:hypothetical protein
MRDDPYLIGLVTCARAGDQQAPDALVDRYAPLVWSTGSRAFGGAFAGRLIAPARLAFEIRAGPRCGLRRRGGRLVIAGLPALWRWPCPVT